MSTAIHPAWYEHDNPQVIGSFGWERTRGRAPFGEDGDAEAQPGYRARVAELRGVYRRLPGMLAEEMALTGRGEDQTGKAYTPHTLTPTELWVALTLLIPSRERAIRACWMGYLWLPVRGGFDWQPWHDAAGVHRPLTYREYADSLQIDAKSAGDTVRRAATNLVWRIYGVRSEAAA